MKAEIRFLLWIGASSALAFGTAPNFLNLLDQSLGDTFGSIFPAIPFAALLGMILALRWHELREILAEESRHVTQLLTRMIGLGTIGGLFVLEPLTGQSVVTAGIALVLTFYAASLALNPSTSRFLLPYAVVCSAGVGAPAVLQWAFGEPLAAASTALSARFVGALGFPVAWQGTQFQFISRTGDLVSGVVTPGCSSIISVTTFLGLLALMHLDLQKDIRSTATLALAGVAVLTVLNSVRIMLLMWVGYVDGSAAFWGIHNWIGYVLFIGFYLATLPVYVRMGRKPAGAPSGRLEIPLR